jgi:hypothetical protein
MGNFGYMKSVSGDEFMYSSITSTKSPSFCMRTFGASLTNLTVPLHQWHDCSCYLRRRILAPPPLWLQKCTDPLAQDFTHSVAFWHRPRIANVSAPEAGDFMEIILLNTITFCNDFDKFVKKWLDSSLFTCLIRVHICIHSFIHSFCSLSYDRSVASSKASCPQSAI